MSDIFVKTAGLGSTGWRKASNIWVKTAGLGSTGWRSVAGIWIKTATQWLKAWPLSGVFATRQAWVGANSDTTYENRMPYSASPAIRIGSNYYGNNAIWDANGWTISSYSYAWRYYDFIDEVGDGTIFPGESGTGSGWTAGGTGQDALPLATWNSSTNNLTYDRKYARFTVTANATNSAYSGVSRSNSIPIVRRSPINNSISLSSTTPTVGVAINLSSSWDTSEARKPEAARTTVRWYRNSVAVSTGGTLIQDSGASNPYSYTPTASDVGNYLYVIEETFNSGSDFDNNDILTGVKASVVSANVVAGINYQATNQQRRVNLSSSFTSGSTVYISTNGYIGIGTDPSGSIFPGSTGLFLMPLQGDQKQTALWTYADSSNFYVRWQGARYNDAAQTIDYQAKFYWNSTAVDVYFVTNNLSSSNPASTTAVYNNGVQTVNWSGSTSQSSTLLSTSSMTRNTTHDGVDDNRTAITASIPALAPVNTVSPSVTPSSAAAGSTFSCSTGTWTNSPTSYAYQWQYFEGGAFGWLSISGQTASTFNSTGYGGLSIRCIVTATNSGGSTAATSNQATVTSAVSIPSGGSVTLTGSNTAGSVITATTSGWANSPTSYDVYITTALSPNTPTSSSSRVASSDGGLDTTATYTITSSDAISPVNVFRAFATASNSAGTSGTVQSSNTITTQAAVSGTAPATPTNGGGTFATGTNYVTNATFTSSASGTTPITYSWTVYSSSSSAGPWSFRNSGSLSSSSLSTTLSIPQQSWNQSSFGSWAQYNVAASNSAGSSPGTLTWLL